MSRFEKVGLTVLGWWDNGVRHTTNSKRPITRPEDLHGLKIRTPPDPMTIDIFQALGAATQQVVDTMESVTEATRQTSATAQQISVSASALNDLVAELQRAAAGSGNHG